MVTFWKEIAAGKQIDVEPGAFLYKRIFHTIFTIKSLDCIIISFIMEISFGKQYFLPLVAIFRIDFEIARILLRLLILILD